MTFPFAFFGGVLALLCLPALPPTWVVAPVAIAAAAGFCWRKRARALSAACVVISGLCCGMLFGGYHAHRYLDQRWPSALADERVIATVIVDSIPAPRGAGWSFDGVVEVRSPATLQRSLRVRILMRDGEIRPAAGERWQMLMTLRPPQGRANPGAVSLDRLLFRESIHALGTVVPSRLNVPIDSGHRPLAALRERISRHISDHVVDRDGAALLSALAVGDTGAVSREQWRVFNATGTTHLVAISGMHVTLFAVVAFALARRVWSLAVAVCPWPRRGLMAAPGSGSYARWLAGLLRPITVVPRENFAALVGFIAAAAYATLAGLSVPTQRTLIMLGAWLLTRSMARASRPFQPFALALIAVLLLDPFAPLSAGFWLSFAAMAAIILVTSGRFMRRPWWVEALSVQAAVTIALVPFTVALFGSVSVIGPLVNVLAIPAMSWVLIPILLLSLVLLPFSNAMSNAVLSLAAWLHDAGWPLLAAASDVPWALAYLSPPWWCYGLALAAVTTALLPWPPPMRFSALIGMLPLAAIVDHPLAPGSAELTVLDVGEGTSVVVRTAHHVLVYGTGDVYGSDGRVAEGVLVPFLRSRGVKAVDVLVEPSVSPSHGAGATALFAAMPVRQTFVAGDPSPAAGASALTRKWVWDGITFDWSAGCDTANASACVLSIRATRTTTASPGELASDFQAQLPGEPAATHTSAYVETATGRWAVVNGRRAHRPSHQRTVERWSRAGVQVMSTAGSGAVRFLFDAERGLIGPEARRADRAAAGAAIHRRLWEASP